MAERVESADALKRITQDISIDRSIRWKEARLLDTIGYRPRSTPPQGGQVVTIPLAPRARGFQGA